MRGSTSPFTVRASAKEKEAHKAPGPCTREGPAAAGRPTGSITGEGGCQKCRKRMRGAFGKGRLLLVLAALSFYARCARCQERAMVAQIATFPYDDALNKGGISFETKDGSDLLRRRLLIASNGDVGFNLPEGSLPEASIHASGDILANKARFTDSVDALSVVATTNVSAHTISAALGVMTQVSASNIAATTVESSDKVLTRDVEAARVHASASVEAREVSVTEDVRTKKVYAAELVNASEVVTTSIKSGGIPFDEVWESHTNEICQDQSDKAENAVVNASSADMCIAACMRVSNCAGVTFYPDPSSREGVDAHCYMAYGACVNISDTLTPVATVYHRPMVRVLDMADELMAAKSEIARLRAEMAALSASMTALSASMTSFTASVNQQLSALSTVATTGSYNDLTSKPSLSLSSMSGWPVQYSQITGTPSSPSLSVANNVASCQACRDNHYGDVACPGGVGNVAWCSTATNVFCYLSRVRQTEADLQTEWAGCEVYVSGGSWYVQANIQGGDTYALCRATCTQITLS
mmetsp:Transcript_5448/g.12722  ORF Transcript_5448/g.12722 Transcript_5448/m.12722 type:complete len:527 (+) Transcript_5448:3-1583(+)